MTHCSGESVLRRVWGLVAGHDVIRIPSVEAPMRPPRIDPETKALILAALRHADTDMSDHP